MIFVRNSLRKFQHKRSPLKLLLLQWESFNLTANVCKSSDNKAEFRFLAAAMETPHRNLMAFLSRFVSVIAKNSEAISRLTLRFRRRYTRFEFQCTISVWHAKWFIVCYTLCIPNLLAIFFVAPNILTCLEWNYYIRILCVCKAC